MHVTPTAIGNLMTTSQFLGLVYDLNYTPNGNPDFSLLNATTLNSLHGIEVTSPVAGEMPVMGYLGIGNKGHESVRGTDDIDTIKHIRHSPIHCGFYNQMPWVVRPLDNDLTPVEREKYRLRKIETHHGQDYVVYYLLKLDTAGVIVKMDIKTSSNGVVTSRDFVFERDAHLVNPDRDAVDNNTVITADGDYISTTAAVKIVLDKHMIDEYINASKIIYKSPDYASISEIGLVSGVERTVSNTIGTNPTGTVTEVIGAQITTFLNRFFLMQVNTTGITLMLDVGDQSPLMLK